MGRVHRLPFLLGGSMAVVAGMISYLYGSENKATFIRMAVVMVIFYIIGIYARNTIEAIREEVEQKKEEELRIQQEAEKQKNAAHKVDLVADDSGEEFSPLGELSKAISSTLRDQS